MENMAGIMEMDDRAAESTVTVPVPEIEFKVAVTLTVPFLSAVRSPPLLIEAIVASELCQVT